MDTNTLQPIARTTTTHRTFWTWVLAVFCVLAIATPAVGQNRQGGRRVTPDQTFETVWVVDRSMPEVALWQTLAHLTSTDGFEPIVIHGGEDERWRDSLAHLLAIVPQGDSIWVSEAGTRFDIDFWASPLDIANDDTSDGPVVYSANAQLDDVATLIAMRLDGVITADPPTTAAPAVLVGVAAPIAHDPRDVYLSDRVSAIDYANQLTERTVVTIVNNDERLLPEVVLWAFQRDAKILEVEVPSYSIYEADTEIVAVEAVSAQIRESLPWLLDGGLPEALVIAGDWHRIPFRFPRGNPVFCDGCDNDVYESSADIEYANLDGDPWGEPDVPVGRLMSPHRDLLAIQSVVGIWREQGAFATATDGMVLDLLGEREGIRTLVADRWQEVFPQQLWSTSGPEEPDHNFRLDEEAFFTVTDRSDVVVVYGHGHPDYLSPNMYAPRFNQALSGDTLRENELSGTPSFWFIHACSTGKPDKEDGNADQTLLVGLQGRLAYGSLMAVEVVGAGSGDPFWWTEAVDAGLSVGELVRRFTVASIAAYRDGGEVGPGMAGANGSLASKRANASSVLYWIGDPLTPMAIER